MKKCEFSNLLFDSMGISQMICIYFVLLNRPEKQLRNSVYKVFKPLGGT